MECGTNSGQGYSRLADLSWRIWRWVLTQVSVRRAETGEHTPPGLDWLPPALTKLSVQTRSKSKHESAPNRPKLSVTNVGALIRFSPSLGLPQELQRSGSPPCTRRIIRDRLHLLLTSGLRHLPEEITLIQPRYVYTYMYVYVGAHERCRATFFRLNTNQHFIWSTEVQISVSPTKNVLTLYV